MLNKPVIFVADTAFINQKIMKQYNLLSVFPREVADGAYRVDYESLLQRSKLQSAFYNELLSKLIPLFETYMPAAKSETKHFVHPVLVKVTSLFIDRSLRILHRIRQQQDDKNIAVAEVESIDNIQWIDDFNQTWHYNQEIIQRIMLALGFEKISILDKKQYPEFPNEHKQKNLLFRPEKSGVAGFVIKVLNRLYNYLEHYSNKNAKFQNLGFGADKFYLAKRGFFGPFGFFQRPLNVNLESGTKDSKLREKLFLEIEEVIRPQIELLLLQVDPQITKQQLAQLGKAYVRFFVDWFPIGYLEGLSSNLEKTNSALNLKKITGVIGHDVMTKVGYFASVSARLAGKSIIGVQHGGHYGYIEDMSLAAQFEYFFYNKIISWGWTSIDSHLPQCETIPLPSPKLSEKPLKSNYFASTANEANRNDILFFSNLFHRFPHISTCGQSRPDYIDEITNSQESLMKALKDEKMTISHKPFSMRFVDLYPEHFKRLEVAGGAGYQLLTSTHKGITAAFIKTCRIIIWDQIGSGTLECFTSEVPTMIYWQRIYSREAPVARELIIELERCGIIHTDPVKLAQEVKNYLADPRGWMENSERKQAIRVFCHKFALTDPQWYKSWRHQLVLGFQK